jgi:hypothetical protein
MLKKPVKIRYASVHSDFFTGSSPILALMDLTIDPLHLNMRQSRLLGPGRAPRSLKKFFFEPLARRWLSSGGRRLVDKTLTTSLPRLGF